MYRILYNRYYPLNANQCLNSIKINKYNCVCLYAVPMQNAFNIYLFYYETKTISEDNLSLEIYFYKTLAELICTWSTELNYYIIWFGKFDIIIYRLGPVTFARKI